MGNVVNISFDKFPKQGDLANKRVKVVYHYDTSKRDEGICVRDDVEEPFVRIFKLDNGRYILCSECQYTF